MSQKDLFPSLAEPNEKRDQPFFYRVYFEDPFKPDEPKMVEVVVHGIDDPDQAVIKARTQSHFYEERFKVQRVEKIQWPPQS